MFRRRRPRMPKSFLRYADLECARLASGRRIVSQCQLGGTDKKTHNHGVSTTQSLRFVPDAQKKILETHASTAFRGALKKCWSRRAWRASSKTRRRRRDCRARRVLRDARRETPSARCTAPRTSSPRTSSARSTRCLSPTDSSDIQLRGRRRSAGGGCFSPRRWRRAAAPRTCVSSAHESGRQLGELTGVAATLWFPLPDLVDAELPPIEGMAGLAIDPEHLNAFLKSKKKTIANPITYRTRTRLASRRTDENPRLRTRLLRCASQISARAVRGGAAARRFGGRGLSVCRDHVHHQPAERRADGDGAGGDQEPPFRRAARIAAC